ncbi:MAG: alpha-glucuronidase [Saprospiraceae bacterium]|nr:alpha-glucuronidase [Saprospiraceae bacterium]
MMPKLIICFFLFCSIIPGKAEDGYRLWLRYDLIEDGARLQEYRARISSMLIVDENATMDVIKKELEHGLTGLLGQEIRNGTLADDHLLLVGTYGPNTILSERLTPNETQDLGSEGFTILSKVIDGKNITIITGLHDAGVLYGVFHFLRLLQTHQSIENLNIKIAPKIQVRILNHWDNLDRTVERGYAGFSIWNWHQLPEYIDPRYIDYARANASIGINGTVLTNVNANALILRPDYLRKVKALADVFRPFGIKVYLTARFSAPIELGGLETADPLDETVQQWWNEKIEEIYEQIPDFGGFVVKANSEGQPGPQNYNRSHADGANMLATALGPHGGIVMWRAFVYSNEEPEDRHKQANNEFIPLDGEFKSNVLIQVKNGAIDFQPREPFHPLFGALEKTPVMMEFQITQEYLGQGTHLAYLGSLWKEVLESDTYMQGKGSTVAKVIDGSLTDQYVTAMAGVANIGSDRNWTSHPFGQANWYAFGRLAWDHELSADWIADEWIRMTFGNDGDLLDKIKEMMSQSHEAVVNYMTPLGLHHIMGAGHHYGPGPWVDKMSRADWTSTYYHRADSLGIGFDRTQTGSDAISQYQRPVAKIFESREKCPEKYLLWFHHVGWKEKLASGKILWDELCLHYQEGVDQVQGFLDTWMTLRDQVDEERFDHVQSLLRIQLKEAKWWRDACISYFQQFSKLPIPDSVPVSEHDLEYYRNKKYPYAPGIRPRW